VSIGFNIRWVGLDAFHKRMSGAGKRVESELEKNMRKAGEYVIGASMKQFSGSRTRARRRGRPVTAPADRLAVDYGTYRQSISQDVRRVGRHKWTTEVGPTVKYARVHELGLRGMPKRQVLTPGVKDSEAAVFRVIGTTFRVV